MKAINHPIVCDKLYAPNHPCDLGFSRLALHAYSLTITMPNGTVQMFAAPVPEAFLVAEQALRG
jgi:23S rRNA-/tRNA-specific pseudouridylate synthase